MTSPVELLRRERPMFHAPTAGPRSITWGIDEQVLEFLQSEIPEGSTTLETGSGLTTVVFIARSSRHIAIAPADEERAAILEFSTKNGMDASVLEYHVARSQDVLPTLDLPTLDAVLVDGDHAFPLPFMDWYYTADHVRRGGLMLIDDVELRTGHVMRQFLREEPEWRHLKDVGHTAVFEKLVDGPVTNKWWGQQPWGTRHYATSSDDLKTRLNVLRTHLRLGSRLGRGRQT